LSIHSLKIKIIYRWWKIALHDAEAKYPGEIKDTYEEFVHDELIQSIHSVHISSFLSKIKLTRIYLRKHTKSIWKIDVDIFEEHS